MHIYANKNVPSYWSTQPCMHRYTRVHTQTLTRMYINTHTLYTYMPGSSWEEKLRWTWKFHGSLLIGSKGFTRKIWREPESRQRSPSSRRPSGTRRPEELVCEWPDTLDLGLVTDTVCRHWHMMIFFYKIVNPYLHIIVLTYINLQRDYLE